MSDPGRDDRGAGDLYARLAALFARATAAQTHGLVASGFADPAARPDLEAWKPVGELPEHLIDRGATAGSARFCVFDGRAYIGVRGSGYSNWERRRLADTRQPVTLILNGFAAAEVAYDFAGRTGWTYFPTELPAALAGGEIRSVEIERDGKLLLSCFVSEDPGARNYRANLWHVSAAGRLSGAAGGATSNVPVEIRIGETSGWTITSAAADPHRPPVFEFDLAPYCAGGSLVEVCVFNPATGAEATRSPVGVFARGPEHFLLANPKIADGKCRAVLISLKEGRRRRLSLAYARHVTPEIVAKVDLEDAAEAWFDGGDNSFVVALDVLDSGEVLIFDEDGTALGELPPLPQILDFAQSCGRRPAAQGA